MMDMEMPHGTPWLDKPLMLHSSRAYECSLNLTSQCEYQQGYWRFWYELDHRYALPTVALFMVGIILFAIPFGVTLIWPGAASSNVMLRRVAAVNRYLSYRRYRVGFLNWNTAPLGILLLGAVGAIFFFSMVLGPKPYYWPNTRTLSYGDSPPLASRSGWMATACMPFIIALSSKSNLVSAVTGVSHEKLQIFHRWISYAMFVLALLHTFPFIVHNIWAGDMVEQWNTSVFYWTGVVALIAQAYLTFASASPLRNWCYEWFKFSHFVAALIFMVFFFFHCDATLTSWDYFIAAGVIYSLTWLHSQLRIYFEHGIGKRATVNLMSNGFVRVAIPMKSSWRAGQHYFVRFLSPALGVHALTSHPFSACSLPTKSHYYEAADSELVFFIRPQAGSTVRLAKLAEKHPNSKMRVLLDGPHGGIDMTKLKACQKILVIAGGSGAGWILPLIESVLRRKDCIECCQLPKDRSPENRSCDVPSMRVILSTRDLATRNWFEEAVTQMLGNSLAGVCPPGLKVEVHYTGSLENAQAPKEAGQFLTKLDDPEKAPVAEILSQEVDSGSDSESRDLEDMHSRFALSIRDFKGRPDTPAIVAEEVSSNPEGSQMGIFLCGPLSMQADVANSVAREQVVGIRTGKQDLYLHMEHFSWA